MQRWRLIVQQVLDEGASTNRSAASRSSRPRSRWARLRGFVALGAFGIPIGMAIAPFGLRAVVRSRRRRYAARIDACAPELALALASSLAAGRSVRGALLTAGAATPEPLASGTRSRSGRPDARRRNRRCTRLVAIAHELGAGSNRLSGAIELHRGSGGDLVRLMRELADAFRARDRALRDAHSASAQARFTAIVVAAIPLVVGVALELARPGSVTGALTLLPTAMMLGISIALMAFGVALAHRIAGAGS